MYYQYANIISVSCGITNNFILNAILNFKVKDKMFIRFLRFYSIGLIGLIISSGLLYFLIDVFRMIEIISKGCTIFVVVILQYNLNKRITFKK